MRSIRINDRFRDRQNFNAAGGGRAPGLGARATMRRLRTSAAAITVVAVMFAALAGATAVRAQVEGGPQDGGAWRAGDFWRFDRRFTLSVSDSLSRAFPGSAGTIIFNERFTKTVDGATPVIEASNSIDGPQRVYQRNRSAASVTGTGGWILQGLPQNFSPAPASASVGLEVLGGTTSGHDWRRVSDLAEVRETFVLAGTIRARVTSFETFG